MNNIVDLIKKRTNMCYIFVHVIAKSICVTISFYTSIKKDRNDRGNVSQISFIL